MKRILIGLGISAAAFAGVFIALRVDRSLERSSVQQVLSAPVVGLSTSSEGQSGMMDFRPAVRRVLPSVVSVDKSERIYRFFSSESELTQTGTGSGVIISKDGYVLTNNHVVEGAAAVRVRLSDQHSYDAKVIGNDPRSDLAVLKIEANNLVPAELGDSGKLEVGEWVIAIGNPLGFSNTVSVGVVSSLNRTLPTSGSVLVNAIQTDAAINQGNSGGALTNYAGQVVGINSAIASPSGGSIGLGFAIPVNRAKKVVSDILKFGRVKYGGLAVAFYGARVNLKDAYTREAIAQRVNSTPPNQGLVIREVGGGSAATAGLKELDIVQKIDGELVNDQIDFYRIMADKQPGDKVSMTIWSAGKSKTVAITLEDLTGL